MIWCLGIFVGGLLVAGSGATRSTREVNWPAFWAPKGSEQRRIGWYEDGYVPEFDWVAISAGWDHTCGIRMVDEDGVPTRRTYCWGNNWNYELGGKREACAPAREPKFRLRCKIL